MSVKRAKRDKDATRRQLVILCPLNSEMIEIRGSQPHLSFRPSISQDHLFSLTRSTIVNLDFLSHPFTKAVYSLEGNVKSQISFRLLSPRTAFLKISSGSKSSSVFAGKTDFNFPSENRDMSSVHMRKFSRSLPRLGRNFNSKGVEISDDDTNEQKDDRPRCSPPSKSSRVTESIFMMFTSFFLSRPLTQMLRMRTRTEKEESKATSVRR